MELENPRYEEEKGQQIQDSIDSDHRIEFGGYGKRQAQSAAKQHI